MSTVPNSVFTWSASASMSDSEATIAPRHHQPMVSEEPPGAKAITIAARHAHGRVPESFADAIGRRRRVDHVRPVSVSAELLSEEQGCSVESLIGLDKCLGEDLEHVRRLGGDVEGHVDVRRPCALGQPHGIVEEQFAAADLEQDRREAG
jgi:hypothetical protein